MAMIFRVINDKVLGTKTKRQYFRSANIPKNNTTSRQLGLAVQWNQFEMRSRKLAFLVIWPN